MLNKFKLVVINPLLILGVIAYLECIPYESDLGKKVYHEMPKVGDNFQIAGDLEYIITTEKESIPTEHPTAILVLEILLGRLNTKMVE